MVNRPTKVMIIGLDAPIVPRLYKYCKEGKLPTLARVIDEGVWAKNGMIPLPTITPPQLGGDRHRCVAKHDRHNRL